MATHMVATGLSSWGDAPSAAPIVNADASSKSAKLLTHRRLTLAQVRDEARKAAVLAIDGAFGRQSRHATCLHAHERTGVSPDVFRRIIEGDTQTLDFALASIITAHYEAVTRKRSPLVSLILQIAGAA